MNYPITPAAFLTVAGIALFGNLVTSWLKRFLLDWRYTPLLTLAICIVTAIITSLVIPNGPTTAKLWEAIAKGFWGGSVAVFGHEVKENIKGLLGSGSAWRSGKRD